MDWQKEIQKFRRLRQDELAVFAPPGEMQQAVFTFNKAIDLLASGSDDIALIALRKLAATHPGFVQPAILLGCCLMAQGAAREAAAYFDNAARLALPENELAHVEQYRIHVQRELEAEKQAEAQIKEKRIPAPIVGNGHRLNWGLKKPQKKESPDRPGRTAMPTASGGAPILQRSGRHERVRMANDKEKREVARRAEFPEEQETHVVYKKDPIEHLRRILPIAGIALVIALLLGAGFLLGRRINLAADAAPDERARLAWLEEQLFERSVADPQIAGLLSEYERFKQPLAGTGDVDETSSAVPVDSTGQEPSPVPATPSPTAQPTTTTGQTTLSSEELAVKQLGELADKLEQARQTQSEDVVLAADVLLQVQTGLRELPERTTVEIPGSESGQASIFRTAGELLDEADSLMQTIGQKAADELRVEAKKLFDQAAYAQSLVLYEKAFAFYPLAYGGGVAYYTGRCYQELNQYELARPYFEFVIENFAGRELAGHAANRLRMMGY